MSDAGFSGRVRAAWHHGRSEDPTQGRPRLSARQCAVTRRRTRSVAVSRPGGNTRRGDSHLAAHRPPVRQPGLKVHQRQAFHAIPRYELRPDSLVVVEQEQAIVESWTLLPERDMRAPMIIALRDGRTSARALAVALDRQPNIAGLKDMRTLLSLVGACHSELELWGHAHVFSANGLRHARPQFPIRVGSRKAYLDRYFEEEMVDVEMDGAAYHGLPGQRERDIRRDAALARIGIQTGQREHECLPA